MTEILYPTENEDYQNKYVDEYDALLNSLGHINYIANETGNGVSLIGNPQNAFRLDSFNDLQNTVSLRIQSGECIINSRYYKTDTNTFRQFQKDDIVQNGTNIVALTITGEPAQFQIILIVSQNFLPGSPTKSPTTESETANQKVFYDDEYIEIGEINYDGSFYSYTDFQATSKNNSETGQKYTDFTLPKHADRHGYRKNDLRDNHIFGTGAIYSDTQTVSVNSFSQSTITIQLSDITQGFDNQIALDKNNITVLTSSDEQGVISKPQISSQLINIQVINQTGSQKNPTVSVVINGDMKKPDTN